MINGMNTIEQYKIMRHIQNNFVMETITYELIDGNSIKIIDGTGDSMMFTYQNGKIIEDKN